MRRKRLWETRLSGINRDSDVLKTIDLPSNQVGQNGMKFFKSIYSAFRHMFNFTGRANRRDFWFWILFAIIVYLLCRIFELQVVAPMLGYLPYEEVDISPVSDAWLIICIIPTISLIVRRVHDHGKPGWMALTIVPLVWWLIAKGDKEPNKYGE